MPGHTPALSNLHAWPCIYFRTFDEFNVSIPCLCPPPPPSNHFCEFVYYSRRYSYSALPTWASTPSALPFCLVQTLGRCLLGACFDCLLFPLRVVLQKFVLGLPIPLPFLPVSCCLDENHSARAISLLLGRVGGFELPHRDQHHPRRPSTWGHVREPPQGWVSASGSLGFSGMARRLAKGLGSLTCPATQRSLCPSSHLPSCEGPVEEAGVTIFTRILSFNSDNNPSWLACECRVDRGHRVQESAVGRAGSKQQGSLTLTAPELCHQSC